MEKIPDPSTADKLIEVAESLFAEKGFYGTSIRDVANLLPIAKSSLLHHFPTKERLYAAVLKKLADEMSAEIRTIRKEFPDERKQLDRFVDLLCTNSREKPKRDDIILRELIDNPKRAEKVKKWFFVDYFNELIQIIRAGQEKGLFKPVIPEVFILHLLGAHRHLIISLPTLRQFFLPEAYAQVTGNHKKELKRFIEERLTA